jgi:hypothetical protein
MPKNMENSASGATGAANTALEEGYLVTGTVKSIKGMCLYVHVGQLGRVPLIGRLHRMECKTEKEFGQLKPGDKIETKILKMSKENNKTWIELSRRKEHMKIKDGLDQDKIRLLSLDTMPSNGDVIEALVTEVAPKHSCPVSIQVSPFIHSQLLFSDCITTDEAQTQNGSMQDLLSKKYKVGTTINVVYRPGGVFVEAAVQQTRKNASQKKYKRGDLCVVRFVKSVKSYGITVQMD